MVRRWPRNWPWKWLSLAGAGALAAAGGTLWFANNASLPDNFEHWWITPAQQAQAEFDRGEFEAAAQHSPEPMLRGSALFRAGEFDQALQSFGQLNSPEAHFNRGNSLVMLGQYAEAISAYEQALALRPQWSEARDNRTLARARMELLAKAEDDAGGTGGMLAADEFVFDANMSPDQGSDAQQSETDVEPASEDLASLWLRRVQTDPADFLRARFSLQLARQQEALTVEASDLEGPQ